MVGDQLADDFGGPRAGTCRAVAADDLVAAVAAGAGTREGHRAEAVDAFDQAAGDQPEPVLVAGPAHHEVDARCRVAVDERLQRVAGQHVAVDDQAEPGAAEYGAAEAPHLGLGAQQLVAVGGGEGLGGGGDLQAGGHAADHAPHLVAVGGLGCAALEHGPPEEPPGPRGGEERAGADGARGLAGDGDPVGVAAEGRDVVPHPLEGGDLVAQAGVGGGVREQSVALHTQSVVDRHADHAVPGEGAAVVDRYGGGALVSAPPCSQTRTGRRAPGPGSGVQTLRLRQSSPGIAGSDRYRAKASEYGGLGAVGPKEPASRTPSQGSGAGAGGSGPVRRGRRVGDAAKDGDIVLVPAAHRAVNRPDHGVRLA